MQEVHENVALPTDTAAPVRSGIDDVLDGVGMISRHIALLVAWVAMCGSLFLSEVYGWPPCVLCWYQRILMYPLALLLPIGILRRDAQVHTYVLPFSLLGAGVSLYHYLLTKTNWLPEPPCTAMIPCSVDFMDFFGFINTPFLALTAFIIISIMMGAWALSTASEAAAMDEGDAAPAAAQPWWARGAMLSHLAVPVIIVLVVGAFVVLGAAELNRMERMS